MGLFSLLLCVPGACAHRALGSVQRSRPYRLGDQWNLSCSAPSHMCASTLDLDFSGFPFSLCSVAHLVLSVFPRPVLSSVTEYLSTRLDTSANLIDQTVRSN